jgi:hypothetical protein
MAVKFLIPSLGKVIGQGVTPGKVLVKVVWELVDRIPFSAVGCCRYLAQIRAKESPFLCLVLPQRSGFVDSRR